MGIYPAPLGRLIRQLSRLPGIGQKSAIRVALYLLTSEGDLAEGLSKALMEVKATIRLCSICSNLADEDQCSICRDRSRDNGILCIVEGPADQMAIEESGVFKGKYHVLHGVLSPLDGVGPEDLKISHLLARLEKEEIKEIILATNPTAEGEMTASFLAKLFSEKDVKMTRIALGVPMGADLKYMDSLTLQHSFKSRSPVTP
ncbi:MAG: recombination mediator RecR [Pseudomonadota bacterium]